MKRRLASGVLLSPAWAHHPCEHQERGDEDRQQGVCLDLGENDGEAQRHRQRTQVR
jgi:hypothetical protein